MSVDFSTVTETAGNQASSEQLRMIHTRYRLAYDLCDGRDVLEVACGPGRALGFLSTRAKSVTGGDYTRALVEAANRHYLGRVPVMELDAQELPFSEGSFDMVILFEAIYYLPEAPRFVKEAWRVLRAGGILLLCTVNSEWKDFNPSPFSVRYYEADALRRLLSGAGFEVEMRGGFLTRPSSILGHAASALKRAAVGAGLMPKTMAGKAALKRLFFGPLKPLGFEIDTTVPVEPLIPIGAGRIEDYKVLYAIARRP